MTKFTPFADDVASVSIAKLTVENGTDRIALYGSLELTRGQQGLAHARTLKATLRLTAERDPGDGIPPGVGANGRGSGGSIRASTGAASQGLSPIE